MGLRELNYEQEKRPAKTPGSIFNFVDNFLTKHRGKKEHEQKLIDFLSDNVLDEREKLELEKIAQSYNLTPEDLKNAQRKSCSYIFSKICEDGVITEDEKKALERLMDYFNVKKEDFKFNQKTFNKFYTLGLIEKGVLPTISKDELNIIFKQGEQLRWCTYAKLKKFKRVTKTYHYSGPAYSIRIMKGVRYRFGSVDISRDTAQYLITDDEGVFWITDLRVGFKGSNKTFTFNLDKIVSIELTPNGLEISKEGREKPYILSLDDYDVPCSMLSFILNR